MAITTPDGSMFDEQQNVITHCPITLSGIYKIPTTVQVIGIQAFSGCSSLTTIELPSTLQKIDMFAFEYCRQLQYLNIPATVHSIGYNAFLHCSSLKMLALQHRKPLLCDERLDIFKNVSLNNCALYVPKGCIAAYAEDKVWSKFGRIIEMEQQQFLGNNTRNSIKKKSLISKSLTKLSLSKLNIFI